jgi:hypothetical protein
VMPNTGFAVCFARITNWSFPGAFFMSVVTGNTRFAVVICSASADMESMFGDRFEVVTSWSCVRLL